MRNIRWEKAINRYNKDWVIIPNDQSFSYYHDKIWFGLIFILVFRTTFSNISIISWRPVLVVEEAGVPGENPDHGQTTGKLYHLRLRVECDKQLVNSITCGCESSADHGQATGKLYHLRLRFECTVGKQRVNLITYCCESSAPFL